MVLGITGGIGTGKSTVLKILEEKYGFYILEADKIGHEIMEKGKPAYACIVEAFGEQILDNEGNIDRCRLAELVFHNQRALEKLNNITHPAVIREIEERIEQQRKKGICHFVIEAALLIESGCAVLCDKVWYIYSEDSVRRERLKTGRGMTEDKITDVIQNQLSYEEFVEQTDAMIDNSFSVENTCSQIEKLLEF